MKKLVALMLVLITVLGLCAAATAEIKVKVLESAHYVFDVGKDNKYRVFMMGVVRNDSDETIQIKSSIVNIINKNKKIVGDDIKSLYVYPEYLDPGEIGYYYRDVTLKDITNPKELYNHQLNLQFETRYNKPKRYLDSVIEAEKIDMIKDYYYIHTNTDVTNQHEDIVMEPYNIIIVRGPKGELMHIYRDSNPFMGIFPGSSARFTTNNIATDLTKVWIQKNLVPTSFSVVSYQQFH